MEWATDPCQMPQADYVFQYARFIFGLAMIFMVYFLTHHGRSGTPTTISRRLRTNTRSQDRSGSWNDFSFLDVQSNRLDWHLLQDTTHHEMHNSLQEHRITTAEVEAVLQTIRGTSLINRHLANFKSYSAPTTIAAAGDVKKGAEDFDETKKLKLEVNEEDEYFSHRTNRIFAL
ncbi:hypothetical protein HD806DRAFT_531077 [Xylariaceae sp. AK1471]|nr:hypothetical protein HD806DRAFT_531077 [Xylariaceae sp. AK1471]